MKKIRFRFAFMGCLMGICLLGGLSCLPTISKIRQTENAPRCSPPSSSFSESDLIGTWMSGRPDQSDTLIIRADGTYQQIIHIEFPEKSPIDYRSDWQGWHLEYSEDNIPYLHLNGMRFCGMNPAISCEKRDGDGYDFCQDKSMKMNGEGILLMLETTDKQYYLHYPLGSENTWIYGQQRP
jgi:hypothetical protein